MTKYDWKKHEKKFYGAKQTPSLINIPKQNFIMISGKGNPNNEDFSNRVGALYSLAYAIKMKFKKDALSLNIEEINDFSVYPLEGVWKQKQENNLVKENLEYTIMIRQPDFITKNMVNAAIEVLKKKKPNPLYEEIKFDYMQDGDCVEILHIGAFDDEPASFAKMDQFSKSKGLVRDMSCHKEIYLNNANRVEKNKLKTILRYKIK